MDIMSAFPSNYVKAGDLQNREIEVAMSHVNVEEIGGDRLPVLYFQGKEKGLVLNKTNANNIALIYGQDTDRWQGQRVTLYPATTDFNGRTVPCIRIKGPSQNNAQSFQAPAQPAPQQTAPVNGGGETPFDAPSNEAQGVDLDDEIPF